MEGLNSKQQTIGKEIEKLLNNYKRQSPDKKTVLYLEDTLASLDKLWSEFEAIDDEIRAKHATDRSHPYFTTDYYNKVQDGYERIRAEIMSLIRHVNQQEQEVTRQTKKIIQTGTTSTTPAPTNKVYDEKVVENETIRLIRKQRFIVSALKHAMDSIEMDGKLSKQYYEVRLDTIKGYWNKIEETNTMIWESKDEDLQNEQELQEYFDLEGKVQEKIVELKQLIENSDRDTEVKTESNNQGIVTLPKITLPKFNGDYLNWKQFHDLFTQMVHNQKMPKAQKMWYLKMNLGGEAEKLVKHLTLTEANYDIAWNILNERYENKRLLVTALLDKLMAQPKIINESAMSLKALHDTTKECLLSLENMGLAIKDNWDPIIMHILLKKLDTNTHTLFKQTLPSPRELQSVTKFLKFIETRFQALETMGHSTKASQKMVKPAVLTINKNKLRCPICSGSHAIYYCENFKKMSLVERQNKVRKLNLCLNCLRSGHTTQNCSSRGCLRCGKKHNTLLHMSSAQEVARSNEHQNKSPTNLAAQTVDNNLSYVFLGTAMASILNSDGKPIPCRILLDSGSQLNFITEKMKKQLRLSQTKVDVNIAGIGNSKLKVNDRLSVALRSMNSNYSTELDVYVVKEITKYQPHQHINIDNWCIPKKLKLADPEFNKPQKVDILLGAELYGEIIRNEQIKLNDGLPILQNTVLGWVVFGKVANIEENFCGISNVELENQLQKFWNLEECPEKQILSTADKKCEEYYEATTFRNEEGRFVVNLPILGNIAILGESKQIAFKRLLSIERRLEQEESLKKQYTDFLDEYISLGHMREVSNEVLSKPHCFLPHHYVLKPTSSTTKLRVVFDASAKTSNNLSLNDLMLKGPKIQEDIVAILLRFRTKRFVFTADINKMYRQILVAEEDRNLQMIMWRNHRSEPIKYYQLCTVTYGTKAAPYLAIKCLQKLAEEEKDTYPLASRAIKDFYVDDVITGSDNLDEAVELQQQMNKMLRSGGFHLRKWCANHPRLVQDIPNEDLEIQLNFSELQDEQIRTLGLIWHPITDWFTVTVNLKTHEKVTKRTVLADMSHVFDPLGLVNPVVVTSKILLQELWKRKLDWDEELPVELQTKWLQFRTELVKLNNIKIPRYMFTGNDIVNIELHAFSDASEKAYGTVLYLRSTDKGGRRTVRLLCSKSRVAPVKPTTLPRLELCAALLAAQVVNYVKESLKLKFEEIYCWTDSQIVLSWLRGDPSTFKTFVANRVANILELTQNVKWKYVNTKLNPADIVSRGMFPEQLRESKMWFEGPEYLSLSKLKWPLEPVHNIRVPEEERQSKCTLTSAIETKKHPMNHINHGNSFGRLQRIMAYVLRAIRMFKGKSYHKDQFLTVAELENATQVIMKEVQYEAFKNEIQCLQQRKQLPRSSKLTTLAPLLDDSGLIRVGGRLDAADIEYNAKHPILVPSDSFVTRLLLEYVHKTNLHAGPQALLALTRQNYWILQGRTLARSIVNNCVTCAKVKPRLLCQQMGTLPPNRVQQARPFINCGVDFCGPIFTHFKLRGKRPQKSYIAVFCCFATKAVHLEIVSDLSTDGFLGALKRFTARRGRCENIYCDNGRNFVGAKNKLEEVQQMFENDYAKNRITNLCLQNKIQFHFIPPRSPHFGGLWEAAVKSIKYLLRRAVANAALTYEELCTVAAEIEAVLNSRPLTPLSSDPSDLTALTPAHFLIGEPMTSTVDPHQAEGKISLLARWQLVNFIKNEFWRRWHSEYLVELQKRAKWMNEFPNIKEGTIVIIKEDNIPPLKWPLGKIDEVVQGPDGKVRVAFVKTATGLHKRAVHLLAPLPVDINENESVSSQLGINENDESGSVTNQMEIDDKDEEPPTGKDQRRTRKRQASSSGVVSAAKILFLTVLFMPLIIFAAPTETEWAKVRYINDKSGIYFEEIGKSDVILSKWSIIIYYDLKGYRETINTANQALNQLKRLSKIINHNEYQTEIIHQYQHQVQEIEAGNLFIQDQPNVTMKTRNRRSPFDIIGTVANKLFGVLDEEYAEKMAQTIQNVKDNENHLLELIKNQTSIVETTVNIVKQGEEERVNQIKRIEENLENLYDKMRNFNAETKQQKAVQAFNTLSILVASLINDCQQMQNAIMDVLTDAHHDRPNFLIISIKQLQQQLGVIKENVPPGLRLPNFDITTLYKLIVVQARIRHYFVIFNLEIPLVSAITFDMYKIIPFPTRVDDVSVTIATTMDYLMASPYKDQFYLLTKFEYMQ